MGASSHTFMYLGTWVHTYSYSPILVSEATLFTHGREPGRFRMMQCVCTYTAMVCTNIRTYKPSFLCACSTIMYDKLLKIPHWYPTVGQASYRKHKVGGS